MVVRVFSDASQHAWGGIIDDPWGSRQECHDRWMDDTRGQPIAVKEALALVHTLQSGSATVSGCRVDAHIDSLTFIQAWKKGGGKSKSLNDALKQLYRVSLSQNISISMYYVPSAANIADGLSRVLSDKDCMLAPKCWEIIERLFGLHTVDLMALDCNVQVGRSGLPLPHFTPFATPASSGINAFAQAIRPLENVYVFPPFVLIGPVLRHLTSASCSFTIIVPKLSPIKYWWPLLQSRAGRSIQLGCKGDTGVLLFPTPRDGFATRPLQWDLFAFRVTIVHLPLLPTEPAAKNLEAGCTMP